MNASGHGSGWRTLTVTGLLAAVVIAWAALPLTPGAGARLVLIVAVVCAAGATVQLGSAGVWVTQRGLVNPVEREGRRLVSVIRAIPWAEALIVTAATLEVLHHSRPWHTGLLGVALLGYLLAVHLAETRAGPAVLWPQLPLLAAGVALMALSVGAAALPALPTGSVSSIVRAIAAVAAVGAAGLAVPAWLDRGRGR